MSGDPAPDTAAGHYERLAGRFDANWAYSPGYITWMTERIIAHGSIRADDVVADIGCGTGLYARGIAATARRVICADPSRAMLDQVPRQDGLVPVLASAQDLAAGRVALPAQALDAIVMKEAIHHVPAGERAATLRGLAGLLRPGGRIVVVMLPKRIGYPLFSAALEMFERDQPDPEQITALLALAGLDTRLGYEEYGLAIPKDHYLGMVRERYMSLLSAFSDAEIEQGIAEIDARHPGEMLEFTDRFAFIAGTLAQPGTGPHRG